MGILSKLEAPRRPARQYGFAAAETGRLTASLVQEADFINRILRQQLRALRGRARQASQNNPFAARFAQLAVDNIAGPDPFRLQSKIRYASGKFDDGANRKMEQAYASWSRKGECEITGRWSRRTLERLMVRILAVDGEVLYRKLRGPEHGKHWYKLQLIDVDRLDEQKNARLMDGGAINMGIEYDPVGRPVAYHILKRKPSQWELGGYTREHERVPAEQIGHIFVPIFAEQGRGFPWMYAALLNLVHIGAFEEAAVIAARVGASQMGVIQSPDGGESFTGDGTDTKGNPQIEAEPGTFPILPPGYELTGWNPRFPDAAVEPFVKAMLRGVAAGLGVAYHNLANDPSDVNYSTAKVFGGDEHEMWRGLQEFWIDEHEYPLHRDWTKWQITANVLPFPLDRIDKYCEVEWQARRWASPDPLKDAKADVELINNKLTSRTRVIAARGEDIEDIFDELAHEEDLAEEKGLDLKPPAAPAAPAPANPDGDENEEEPQDGNATT